MIMQSCMFLDSFSETIRDPLQECIYYNGKGCAFALKCKNLHVCRHFFKGRCKNGGTCDKSHNFLDVQPKALLVARGIDISRPEQEIREQLSGVGRALIGPRDSECSSGISGIK